jgi:cyclase
LGVTSAPVIVAGGAGDFSHLRDAFELAVDAVACGTLFNFGDNNPIRAKAYLRNYGVPLKRLV